MSTVEFQAICKSCKHTLKRHDGSTSILTKHLKAYHPDIYRTYLEAQKESAKKRKVEAEEQNVLEQEVEQVESSAAEAAGAQTQVRRKPRITPVTDYFRALKAGPAKYSRNSDYQRTAELEIAIYIATSNKSFKEVDSEPFRR